MGSFNEAKGVFNPFDRNIYGLINSLIENAIKRLQTCIPAIVKKVVDRNTIIAVPAVQQTDSDWNAVDWAEIKLPVYSPLGSGIIMSFPLAAGDTGWIIAGDLDPSLFFQDVSEPAKQAFYDRHKYQYGFFMPANLAGFTFSQNDDGQWVVTSSDGKTKIVLGSDGINLETDKPLKIKGDSVSITSSGNNISIDGTDWKTHSHDAGEQLMAPNGNVTGQTGGVM